ncbi:unnamed protein product, partial [Urochloa humidicola]
APPIYPARPAPSSLQSFHRSPAECLAIQQKQSAKQSSHHQPPPRPPASGDPFSDPVPPRRRHATMPKLASEKTRSKAMALVAKAGGVSSMGVTGDGKDQLEVVGDGVDTVCLVQCLRRKIGPAEIVKVEEVKSAEKKPEPLPYLWYHNYYHCHPPPPYW